LKGGIEETDSQAKKNRNNCTEPHDYRLEHQMMSINHGVLFISMEVRIMSYIENNKYVITNDRDYKELSEYEIEDGHISYERLAEKVDSMILCNEMHKRYYEGKLTLDNGTDYDEENDQYCDIYQWFIIDNQGASTLSETDEIVYYDEELEIYVWGITHFGTSWSIVMTDIEIDDRREE